MRPLLVLAKRSHRDWSNEKQVGIGPTTHAQCFLQNEPNRHCRPASSSSTSGGRTATRRIQYETNPSTNRALRAAGRIQDALFRTRNDAPAAAWRRDLAIEEQLCAMIDKCLKRLLIVRGLKPISATLSSVISAANCRSSKSA
jgi:hypothetical protein